MKRVFGCAIAILALAAISGAANAADDRMDALLNDDFRFESSRQGDVVINNLRQTLREWQILEQDIFDTFESIQASQPSQAGNPVGEVKTTAIGNGDAVGNGPRVPVVVTTDAPILVKSIRTYHWNNGRGSSPGTIAMQGSDGQIFGPWQAIGLSNLSGAAGPPDLYWLVEPETVLPTGKYLLQDSDPASWATNAKAGNRGFFTMQFQKVAQAESTPAVEVPAEPAKPPEQPAEPVEGKRYENPFIGEFRLDWCLKDGKDCGKPAADEFCRYWNLNEAVSFSKAEDIGKYGATREILDGAFCERPDCDGFAEIICR